MVVNDEGACSESRWKLLTRLVCKHGFLETSKLQMAMSMSMSVRQCDQQDN